FSPVAHNTGDPNLGFTLGAMYTLRWAPPGDRNKPGGVCPGDAGFNPGSSADRGYIDVGQGNGNSDLRDAVVNSSFFLDSPLAVGDLIDVVSGQKGVPSAVEERFNQDTDTTAATYSSYHGNGRRLLTVAVNDGSASPRIAGFALFFLHATPCGDKNTTPCCAEYVGPAVFGSRNRGAGGAGLYVVQLLL